MNSRNEQPVALEQNLFAQEAAANEEASKIMDRKMDVIARYAKGENASIDGQFKAAYAAKAKELTTELLKLQAALQEKLAPKYLEGLHQTLLTSLQGRMKLSMEVMKVPEAKSDYYAQLTQGLAFLQNIDVPSLIYDHLAQKQPAAAEFYLKSIESRGMQLETDLKPILENIQNDRLTDKDWEVIVSQTRVLAKENPEWLERGVAVSLMATLTPAQKTVFVEKMLSEPGYQGTLQTLVLSSYLTVTQVTEPVEARLAMLKPSDLERRAELEAFLLKMQDKDLAQAQQKVQEAILKEVKEHPHGRRFGESNIARKLLSFKGILGSIVAINGMATMGANILMNLHDPKQLLTNKGLGIGIAMTGLGLEFSDGFGGLLDKPSENLAQLATSAHETAQGRDDAGEKIRTAETAAFEAEFLRYPKASRIYAQYVEQINAAYAKKAEALHASKVDLTMEEMGLNGSALQKEFEPLDKVETEKVLSRWVSSMGDSDNSTWKSVDSQRNYLTIELRKKYGLPVMELWTAERAQKYEKKSETSHTA